MGRSCEVLLLLDGAEVVDDEADEMADESVRAVEDDSEVVVAPSVSCDLALDLAFDLCFFFFLVGSVGVADAATAAVELD